MLRRDVAWVLLLKAAALGTLWLLFFSPAHQRSVTEAVLGAHLALDLPAASAASAPQEPPR